MANINSIKRVEIFPSNRATANNTWSYKDGNPTLVYNFGVQNAYLMSDTLRINFTLKLFDLIVEKLDTLLCHVFKI